MKSKTKRIRDKVIANGRKKVIHKVSNEGLIEWLKELGVDIENKDNISTDREVLDKLISDLDENERKIAIEKFEKNKIRLK